MGRFWVLGHMLFLSVEDIKERQLSLFVILELGCSGILPALREGYAPQWGPGLLILAAGFISREQIGYGDGWLLLALGMWMPLLKLLYMLLLGIGLGMLYGLCFRQKELPLVPFLTVAYIIGEWI